MRLGWGHDGAFLAPGRSAAGVLRAGVHSTLHGVVFAIFCPGPAVHRRRDGMISGQTLRVCPEGEPVPTHRVVARGHAFPDHALKLKISSTLSVLLMERARLAKA